MIERVLRLIGRIVLWAAVLLVFVNGTVALIKNFDTSSPERAHAARGERPEFPKEEAAAFAARFAHDYLTYDEKDPTARQELLSAYLSTDADPLFGWDGNGKQVAVNSIPVKVEVRDESLGVVTVAVNVTGPRWVYLAVPVVGEEGRLVVAERPSIVAAPERAEPLVAQVPDVAQPDTRLATELHQAMESFFKAYASGNEGDISYFLPPGGRVEGLGGVVEFDELEHLEVESGDHRREGIAQVRWLDRLTGGALSQSYRLHLVRQDGRWYVQALGAVPGGE